MGSAMVSEASGACVQADGDCGSLAAIPYFISFQIIGSFIFLNLVVAVILENFATLHFVSPELVSSADLETFSDAWSIYDPEAVCYPSLQPSTCPTSPTTWLLRPPVPCALQTNFMPMSKLPEMLLLVPRPLGVKVCDLPRSHTFAHIPQSPHTSLFADLR